MKKILIVIALLLLPVSVMAADIKLHWNANTEPDLAGYTVHYGTASGVYDTLVPVGNVTDFVLSGLVAGTYYIALSANDSNGNTSAMSYEIKIIVYVGTPTGLGAG